MKKFLFSIALILFLTSENNAHVDHYSKYNYLEYELFRNNQLIGYHKYKFYRKNEDLKIDNEVSFEITKLGINLYKYYAKGIETYSKGVFKGFKSKTNQNKKNKYVNISIDPDDKNLVIDGSSFKGKADKDMIIGTWWNHEIVQKKAQISAVSGRIIEQKVEFLGKKQIKLNGKNYEALHFKFLSSDKTLPDNKKLNTDIWYDAKTLIWLKARFVKQGNWEYRLKKLN